MIGRAGGPWFASNRTLMERAVARGEAAAYAPVETLSTIIPSLSAFRSLGQRRSFDRAFLATLIDDVLLPALGIGVAAPTDGNSHRG